MDLKQLKLIGWIISTILVCLLLAIAFVLPSSYEPLLRIYGYIGLFLFLFLCSATFLVPAPNIPAILYASHFLGMNSVGVILSGALGWSSGELLGYMLGRLRVMDTFTPERYKTKIEYWTKKLEGKQSAAIFWSSAFPNPLFDIIGYVAGHQKISFYKFFFFCFMGRLLLTTLIVMSTRYLIIYFF